MINLIPPSAKKSIAFEYWKRVIATWLLMGSAALIILSVFLLPTQIALRTEISALENVVSTGLAKVATYDITATELVTASNQAKLLLETSSTNTPSDLITILNKYAGDSVMLNNFQFSKLTTGGSITLSGIADSRQALALFRDRVTLDTRFTAVNLPIANLIKDKDLLFNMEIVLATTTTI